jgi:hypothetical protein
MNFSIRGWKVFIRGVKPGIRMLEKVRGFAHDLAPVRSDFTDLGMPADVIEDLEADIAAFEAAYNAQGDARRGGVGANADIDRILDELLEVKQNLNVVARNIYRCNPQKLAEWKTAYHGGRARKSRETETPPNP